MSSGFISETEIAEQRRKRQEEWEKVRQDDQPEEAPEETYDPRSLFERLEEQKQKKDHEFEEAHKLKNMIKGLDDDEVDFLDLVDRTKLQVERQQNLEEARELQDYRDQVASLQEKNFDQRIQAEIGSVKPKPAIVANRVSQRKILAGVVVKKRKLSETDADAQPENKSPETKSLKKKHTTQEEGAGTGNNVALRCIGILPGLGAYDDSSNSEDSSISEDDENYDRNKFDLLGRRIPCKSSHIHKNC